MDQNVVDFYSEYNEAERLGSINSIEFIRSKEIILRNLQNTPNKIIDIGGAAGRYSFWLSSLGHDVSLVDLTPKHIEQAILINNNSEYKLTDIKIGNALQLPYCDQIFDTALIMGPLYHLLDMNDRINVIKEALRVIKKEGVLIMAYISRFASMLDGFKYNLVNDELFRYILNKDLRDGNHINNTDNSNYFTTAYLHHPDEIEKEIKASGGFLTKMYAIEGISNCIVDLENKLENEIYREYLLSKLAETEEDKSIIGISSHIMAIAKKA